MLEDRTENPAGPARLNVILNWNEELKQRIPLK
jgi:hypothetical protein